MQKERKIKWLLATIKGEPRTKHFVNVYHFVDGERVLIDSNEIEDLSENLEIEIISERSQVDESIRELLRSAEISTDQ